MKQRIALLSVTALVLTGTMALAAARANFSGTWVMDKSRSEGIPPNVAQTMTLTQVDDKLTLQNKIVTAEGDININDTFTVDLSGKTPNGDLHTKRTFVKK